MNQSKTLFAALFSAVVFSWYLPAQLSADTIDWGTSFAPTDSVDSFANPLDGNYTFYVGAFNALGSFTPTRSNIDQWASNWTTFNSVSYVTTGPFADSFGGSASISNNTVFAAGERAFIWGLNDMAIGGGTEWILLTSPAWLFPTAEAIDPSVTEFYIPDLGDPSIEAIYGAYDSMYTGSETGINVDASGGDGFDLQTEAVPEPGTMALLGLSAGGFAFLRRRRRVASLASK